MADETKTKPLGATEVARTLLEARFGGSGGNSISLTRNAKGVTQIDVTAREAEGLGDLKDAVVAVYNSLRALYPMPDGKLGAENTELETPFS